MSIVRKKGQAALTRRQQRRRRPDRGLDEDAKIDGRALHAIRRGTRRTRTHAMGDMPQPKQPGFDSAHNRAFKGLLYKPDANARYEGGPKPSYTWERKRRRRARQEAARAASA